METYAEPSRGNRALRRALLPQVEDLVIALQMQGMSKTEACKAVRWAAHVVEGREE